MTEDALQQLYRIVNALERMANAGSAIFGGLGEALARAQEGDENG